MDHYSQSKRGKSNRRVAGVHAAKGHPTLEYGFVTLLILVLFATLSAYGLETYIKGHLENKMVRREINSRQAVYASEGGIEWAKSKLNEDPAFSGGEIMIGDGRVQVQVTGLETGYKVISSVQYGVASRRIQVLMEKNVNQWVITSYQELHQ